MRSQAGRTTSRGDVLAGVVRGYVPGKTLGAMVVSLNEAILNIETTTIPRLGHFLYLSPTIWGLPRDEVDALKARLAEITHGLFPQPSATPKAGCAAG